MVFLIPIFFDSQFFQKSISFGYVKTAIDNSEDILMLYFPETVDSAVLSKKLDLIKHYGVDETKKLKPILATHAHLVFQYLHERNTSTLLHRAGRHKHDLIASCKLPQRFWGQRWDRLKEHFVSEKQNKKKNQFFFLQFTNCRPLTLFAVAIFKVGAKILPTTCGYKANTNTIYKWEKYICQQITTTTSDIVVN